MSALLWLVALATALAQAPSLSRDDVVRAVLDHNPSLRADLARIEVARTDPMHIRSLPDPRLSLGTAPLSLTGERPGVSVALSQALPPPGSLRSHAAVAHAMHRATQAEAQDRRLELAVQGAVAFDELWRREQVVVLLGEHERLLTSLRDAVQRRYEAGGSGLSAVLEARSALLALSRERDEAAAQVVAARARLNALMGRPADAALALSTPALAEVLVDPQTRPDEEAAEARVESAQAQLRRAHRDNGPGLAFNTQYSSMWAGAEHRWMVGMAMDLPVYRRQRSARLTAATAARTLAEEEQRALADAVGAEQVAAQALYDSALRSLSTLTEDEEPLASARLAAVQDDYQAGRADLSAVLAAARAQVAVQLERARALSLAHARQAELLAARGHLPLQEVP